MESLKSNCDISKARKIAYFEELDLPASIPSRYLVVDEYGGIWLSEDVDDNRRLKHGQGVIVFRQAMRQLKDYIAERHPDRLTYRSRGMLASKTSLLYRLAFLLGTDNYSLSILDGTISLIRQNHSFNAVVDYSVSPFSHESEQTDRPC